MDGVADNAARSGWADGLCLALLFALLGLWLLPSIPRARTSNALRQGSQLIESKGCVSCHAAPGLELGNPGSDRRRVPSLVAWAESGQEMSWREIEEWIADGHPASLMENPVAWKAHLAGRIHMPAYGDRLHDKELEALVAWALVAGGHVKAPAGRESRGETLARNLCLHCHGVGGAGGRANPGSIAGYVPALWGADYEDLVQDEDELKEWIVSGGSARIASLPWISGIWKRQAIRMPAFGGELSESELEDLMAYLKWLRENDGGIVPARAGREEIDHDS